MARFFTQPDRRILIVVAERPVGVIHPDGALDTTTVHGATTQREELVLVPRTALLSALDLLEHVAHGIAVEQDLAYGTRAVLASYVPPPN